MLTPLVQVHLVKIQIIEAAFKKIIGKQVSIYIVCCAYCAVAVGRHLVGICHCVYADVNTYMTDS